MTHGYAQFARFASSMTNLMNYAILLNIIIIFDLVSFGPLYQSRDELLVEII